MTVAEIPFAAIDFESAGIRRGGTDVPVQIGIAQMRGGAIGDSFVSFLSTDQPITWSAQKVHGISRADLAGAPALTQLWPQVKSLLEGRWLVAHGAATEKRFLRAFPFNGFGPWVDTLKLSRAAWPELASFSLSDLLALRGLEGEARALRRDFRWHDALSDSLASLVLLRHLIAETAIGSADAEVILRADDSLHHRLRARRQ